MNKWMHRRVCCTKILKTQSDIYSLLFTYNHSSYNIHVRKYICKYIINNTPSITINPNED